MIAGFVPKVLAEKAVEFDMSKQFIIRDQV